MVHDSNLKGLLANKLPFGIIPGRSKQPVFANLVSKSTLKLRSTSRNLNHSEDETSASKQIANSEQRLQPVISFIPGELNLDNNTASEMADIKLKQSLLKMQSLRQRNNHTTVESMTNLEMNLPINLGVFSTPRLDETYSQQRSLKYKTSIAQMKKMP